MYLYGVNDSSSTASGIPANSSGYITSGFSVLTDTDYGISQIKLDNAANNPFGTDTTIAVSEGKLKVDGNAEDFQEILRDGSKVYVGTVHDGTASNLTDPDFANVNPSELGTAAFRISLSVSNSGSPNLNVNQLDLEQFRDNSYTVRIGTDNTNVGKVTQIRTPTNVNDTGNTLLIYLDSVVTAADGDDVFILKDYVAPQATTGYWRLIEGNTVIADNVG